METRADLQRALQLCAEFLARDLDEAELFQMRIVELRIQQHIAPVDQPGDEMDERNL